MCFNGETGTVVNINEKESILEVLFDDGSKESFRGKELRYIDLCYAQTINKSMGSECKAAVIAYKRSTYHVEQKLTLYSCFPGKS